MQQDLKLQAYIINYKVNQQLINQTNYMKIQQQQLYQSQSQEQKNSSETSNLLSNRNVEDIFVKEMNDQDLIVRNEDSLFIDYTQYAVQASNQLLPQSQENNEKFEFKIESRGKKIKKFNMCGHEDRGHYAKGMCRSCYTKYGRTKKPWNCLHDKLYAQGLCQLCYTNKYNKIKRTSNDKNSNASFHSGSPTDV